MILSRMIFSLQVGFNIPLQKKKEKTDILFFFPDQAIDWSAIESLAYDKPREQGSKDSKKSEKAKEQAPEAEDEPTQLENGRWACNHKCKDKTA